MRGELIAELSVSGTADPERVPGTEHVVEEPVLRELVRLDGAAEPVVPLEDADAPPALRKERTGGE